MDLPEPYQKPWGRVQISSLQLQIRPPPKQKRKKPKISGGGPFTIVDATLYLHKCINDTHVKTRIAT